MKEEWECMHNLEPVCPYCGYEYMNAWELEDEYTTIECGDCEKEYEICRNIQITYSTYPTEEPKQ